MVPITGKLYDYSWDIITDLTSIRSITKSFILQQFKKDSNQQIIIYRDKLQDPLRWESPKKVLVGAGGDLFHEETPFEFIEKVFKVMRKAENHTFMVLTERPNRAKMFLESDLRRDIFKHWPFPNVWLGVYTRNYNSELDVVEKLNQFIGIPATKKFLVIDPSELALDLRPYLGRVSGCMYHCPGTKDSCHLQSWECQKGQESKEGISMVICKKDPKNETKHAFWIMHLVNQCMAVDVPVLFMP